MKRIIITALIITTGCTSPTEPPTLECTGHFDFYQAFPASRGTGSLFVFTHAVYAYPDSFSAALLEQWINDDGSTEVQYTCLDTPVAEEARAIKAANRRHRAFEAMPDPENEINCN